jgi:hypothetical protein
VLLLYYSQTSLSTGQQGKTALTMKQYTVMMNTGHIAEHAAGGACSWAYREA